ncbi:MAG: shikimate dehydrogenase, partial [Simkaniaceae bacterium]|nr:shikimate dehydrogenase [Simkaniaceae bacterium]
VYIKLRLTSAELESFFSLITDLPFHGFAVTMPLKEHVAPYLEFIDNKAKAIGAINTLNLKKGEWHGLNTDSIGALNALEKKMLVRGKKVVILGVGGAGKAIAYEAIERGAKVILLNRTKEKAVALATHLGCTGDSLHSLKNYKWDILINTTSVGMSPNVDETPVLVEEILKDTIVMDAVWSPFKTKLLKSAEKKGCQIVYGYEMFIYQAAEQFAIYFNEALDRERLIAILDAACQNND